jgi:hypothetical protein
LEIKIEKEKERNTSALVNNRVGFLHAQEVGRFCMQLINETDHDSQSVSFSIKQRKGVISMTRRTLLAAASWSRSNMETEKSRRRPCHDTQLAMVEKIHDRVTLSNGDT